MSKNEKLYSKLLKALNILDYAICDASGSKDFVAGHIGRMLSALYVCNDLLAEVAEELGDEV